MALKEDYKDAVFAGLRKYKMLDNGDGTVSPVDMTEYEAAGDKFGAKDVNAITKMVNCTGDAFDPGRDYEVGDYTIYDNTVWKFTTAHPAGEWDESHVEKTRILVEIAEQNKNFEALSENLNKLTSPTAIAYSQIPNTGWQDCDLLYSLSDFNYLTFVVYDSNNSFSTYKMPIYNFRGTKRNAPFGGNPPQTTSFGLCHYISDTSIGIYRQNATIGRIEILLSNT